VLFNLDFEKSAKEREGILKKWKKTLER
jgi:hypothetical protein